MLRFYFILFFITLTQIQFAQEVVLPIQRLPITEQPTTQKKGDDAPLTLPFFDDFSYQAQLPDVAKWADQNVFINDGFAKNTVSVGVATFDCLDIKGALYDHLDYYNSYQADILTSKPIDLSSATSVFLSFLYQGAGNGPIPATDDSLTVEFYSKSEDKWISVWYVNGEAHENFQTAFIPVTDAKFLTDAFQFRFTNYVTIGKDDKPTLRGNSDVWNIDYVYLDQNRTDGENGFDDINFIRKSESLIKNYESVPWKHYVSNPSELTKDSIISAIYNNGNTPKNINALNFHFIDVWGEAADGLVQAGSYDLTPNQTKIDTFKLNNFLFNSTMTDSALFHVKSEMLLDETDFWADNNITVYEQAFKDYYAYDDGTAEAGYGISGNASSNAQVAYLFENYKPDDEMWGVEIFFTKTLNAANLKYFYLTVWEAPTDTTPGTILYQQPLAETLKYTEGQNVFNLLRFHEQNSDWTDTAIVAPKKFFIGWEQTVEGHLGIGLDRNRKSNDKLFYNVTNEWVQSNVEGALMMRPVFRKREKIITSVEKPDIQTINFYPNPASEYIQVNMPDMGQSMQINIYDLSGKQRLSKQVSPFDAQIQVSDLPTGMYIIRGTSDKNHVYSGKLIIR